MVRKIFVVFSLIGLVFVYGCPGGGGSDTGAGAAPSGGGGGETGDSSGTSAVNEDTTPPRITNRSPSSGAEDVDLNESVVVYISEGVAADSVNSDTFILQKKSDLSAVDGSVSYDQNNRIGTLKPAAPLVSETEYQATVKKEVKDLAGNRMSEDDVWSFKTGKESDTTAPQLMNTTPADGDKDVNLDTIILVNFNEYIKSISSADFSLMVKKDGSWETVAGDIGVDGAVATFTPKAELSMGGEYKASIQNVSDLAGNAYAGPHEWQFKTIASKEDEDITPPEVTSTVPENNGEAASLDQNITVSFTEEINFNADHYVLFLAESFGENEVETKVASDVSYADKTMTINPDDSLQAGKNYKVKVSADIEDLAGNAMGKEFVLSFTTAKGAELDATPPSVTQTGPSHGASNVGTNQDVIIYMSEAIQASFSLQIVKMVGDVEGDAVGFSSSIEDSIVTASTGGLLKNNTTYKVTLSDVKDLAGNEMTPNKMVFSFTTEASLDTTPPSVLDVGPLPMTAVALDAHLTVEFSEEMDPATMIVSNFGIIDKTDPSLTEVEKTISYNKVDGKFIAEIIPNENWKGSATYSVVVLKGEKNGEGVKDSAGNKMASFYNFEFTTIPLADTVPPSVSDIVPPDGATDVSIDTHILIYFSEAMKSEPDIMNADDFEIMKTETEDKVSFTLVYDTESNAVELTPLQPFDADTAYMITVWGSGLFDLAGNVLSDTSYFSFTTAAALEVDYYEPGMDEMDVPVGTHIFFYFTKAIDPETVTVSGFNIENAITKAPVGFTVAYVAEKNAAELVPSQLNAGTTYVATVLNDGLTDLAGNALLASQGFKFTTAVAAPDTGPPLVDHYEPGMDEMDVPVGTHIFFYFTKAMDPETVTVSGFNIENMITKASVGFTVTYVPDKMAAELVPLQQLDAGTTYVAAVLSNTLTDLAGNALPASVGFKFTTAVADTVAPTVANTDPENNAIDVPIDKVITVEFSEEMDKATMVKSYFMLLRYEGGKPYVVNINDIEFDEVNKVSITPLLNLANSTQYKVYVKKAVKDLSGNVMAAGYMSSFTTVAQ